MRFFVPAAQGGKLQPCTSLQSFASSFFFDHAARNFSRSFANNFGPAEQTTGLGAFVGGRDSVLDPIPFNLKFIMVVK